MPIRKPGPGSPVMIEETEKPKQHKEKKKKEEGPFSKIPISVIVDKLPNEVRDLIVQMKMELERLTNWKAAVNRPWKKQVDQIILEALRILQKY